jgi:hypothetical protein
MGSRSSTVPDPDVQGSHIVIDLSNVNTNSPADAKASQICAAKPGG